MNFMDSRVEMLENGSISYLSRTLSVALRMQINSSSGRLLKHAGSDVDGNAPVWFAPLAGLVCCLMAAGVFSAGLPAELLAQELPTELEASPAARMTARIDELLARRLSELGWAAAGPCDDASFIRRVHLDLTGRPPAPSQVIDFLENKSDEKRTLLIDQLLASPDCASHFAATWAEWLLPAQSSLLAQGPAGGLEDWMRKRFAGNLRYDRLVADLLVATGSVSQGPSQFFAALEGKPEKLAARTARVFMGVQLDCAECHDHPFDQWSQKEFWGFAAYFAQLSQPGDESRMQAFELKDSGVGEVTLPGSSEVIPPKPLVETGFSGLESGTRRQQLTLWLTARENPFLARATVNRVWALLMGRGLVEPIDDMSLANPASHPELLQELSDYFSASGYDLRDLVAMITKTKAYSRDSYHQSGPPPEASYATMLNKPLSERQVVNSVRQIARQLSGTAVSDERDMNARAVNDRLLAQFSAQLGKLRGDASEAKLGMVSALVTLHGDLIDLVSREDSSQLVAALQAPYFDASKQMRWLFLATLNRFPTQEEQVAFSDLLGGTRPDLTSDQAASEESSDVSLKWQSDLLWALLNSSEFAMTP